MKLVELGRTRITVNNSIVLSPAVLKKLKAIKGDTIAICEDGDKIVLQKMEFTFAGE